MILHVTQCHQATRAPLSELGPRVLYTDQICLIVFSGDCRTVLGH